MINMQSLSRVVIQHIITKIFGKPRSAISTFFKGTEIEVVTRWSGDDLKIVIKKIRGQVSRDGMVKAEKKIWTPGDPGGVVKSGGIVAGK